MAKYDWPELIKEHEESGLSQLAFCKARHINPKYFNLKRSHYLRHLEAESGFVKVQAPLSSANSVMLRHGSVDIVFSQASPDYVASVVRALA